MNNFGVIELASAKTTNAPGWAYVTDRQPPPHLAPQASSAAGASTSNRKRSRAAAAAGGGGGHLSLADASARQEAKTRRELEILDRDNARDAQVSIPAKPGGGGGGSNARTAGKKYTPNVRRILQSQKTFANHLDDYMALASQQETNPTSNSNNNNSGPSATTATTSNAAADTTASRRAGQKHGGAPASPMSGRFPGEQAVRFS